MNLTRIEGGGAITDRAGALADKIKALCYQDAEGMSLAAVIGCLEIVKLEILGEAK